MSINKHAVKKKLFAAFTDRVTGYSPQKEVELSAILAVLHQRREIRWNQVPLYTPSNEATGHYADSLLAKGGTISCEYPMISSSQREVNTWGAMTADLLYVSNDYQTIVLIENKIGSSFTSGDKDVETGQLARQIEYLNSTKVSSPYLILLSSDDFFLAGWYFSELVATLQHKTHCNRVQAYLMKWEDICQAL